VYPETGVALTTDVVVEAAALKKEPVALSGFVVFAILILPAPLPTDTKVAPEVVGVGMVLVLLELAVEKLAVEEPKFCVDVCPHPCEAKAKKARTIAAKPPKRVKG